MKVTNQKTGKKEDVRLPKEFKKKWIAALRSGEFKQNHDGFLQDGDGNYCCLGVACKITHPRLNIEDKCLIAAQDFTKVELKRIKVPSILKGGDDIVINPIVAKLTNMNDSGKSFKVIASYIEKNL